MTLVRRLCLQGVKDQSVLVPAMASQNRGFGGEAANGELDAMPVVERRLTNDLGIRLVTNLPSEIGGPFDGEVPMMRAVGEIEGEDGFHKLTLSKANFASVSAVLNPRFVGCRRAGVLQSYRRVKRSGRYRTRRQKAVA